MQFPIGISSIVLNSFPSSFPKLTCQLMSSGNLTYFTRLYLMCLSTCSMKPIILLTVVTILPNQWSPANPDASSNPVSMVSVSTNKVSCPFPKGGTLVDLPGNKNEVLSPVLCKDTGCPDVKFPGLVLPLASTPRVSSDNLTNVGSICASLWKLETFAKSNYSTPCNCIVGPIEEKVLPPPMEFPAQSMVASHPSGVDGYSEDSVSEAPIYVQSTSTHHHVITFPDEHLNWPRLILMAKGQPQ